MSGILDPAGYDAWYYSGKGRWIGDTEFSLVRKLIHTASDETLLDVGCGTGYFSQRFYNIGLRVTGVDLDFEMLSYAKSKHNKIKFIQANAYHLPFRDNSFDYVTAITSLCFVKNPQRGLEEMWRISRKGIVLGLLNRNSLLYILKHNSVGYKGARWDTTDSILPWVKSLNPKPQIGIHSTIWCPFNNPLCQIWDNILPTSLRYGGFLAISLNKNLAT